MGTKGKKSHMTTFLRVMTCAKVKFRLILVLDM